MDKNLTKVSVIVVTKDRADLLKLALNSVISQTYSNWEIIIVDDGSKDNTENILKEEVYLKQSEKIIYIKNTESIGISASRNIGLQKASGRYIAVLDSDDMWHEQKLEKQIEFLNKNQDAGICILGTNIKIIDKDGDDTGSKKYKSTDQEIRDMMLGANPFCHSSIIIDKSKADQNTLYYDEKLDRWEDYELFLRLGREKNSAGEHKIKFGNLEENLTYYRIHGSNISKTKKLQGAILHLKLSLKYRRYYAHPLKWTLKNLARIGLTLLKKS